MHDQAFWLDNGPYQKSANRINRFLEILASKFYKNCEHSEHSEIKFIMVNIYNWYIDESVFILFLFSLLAFILIPNVNLASLFLRRLARYLIYF